MVKKELAGQLNGRMTCAGCLRTRSPEMFDPSQLVQSPGMRLCLEAEGSLVLCPHKFYRLPVDPVEKSNHGPLQSIRQYHVRDYMLSRPGTVETEDNYRPDQGLRTI